MGGDAVLEVERRGAIRTWIADITEHMPDVPYQPRDRWTQLRARPSRAPPGDLFAYVRDELRVDWEGTHGQIALPLYSATGPRGLYFTIPFQALGIMRHASFGPHGRDAV